MGSEMVEYAVCEKTKGELSSERQEKCETLQNNFQKLLQTTQTLAVSSLHSCK